MQSLRTYYHAQLHVYHSALTETLAEPSERNIHLLRVTTKRLNALYQLASYADPHFNAKRSFRDFKDIFEHFGRVRDLDITIGILKKNKTKTTIDLTPLIRYLQQHSKKLSATIVKHVSITKSLTAPLEDLEHILSAIDIHGLDSYLNDICDDISERTAEETSIKRLHNARKRYKIYLYLSETLRNDPAGHAKHLHRIHSVQRSLGNWHDIVTSLEQLEYVREHHRDIPLKKKELREIITQIAALEQYSRKEILEELADK